MAEQPVALLIVEKGAEDASVIPLGQRAHIIGKPPQADISLLNPFVSRQHAQIRWDQGRFQITDLGSKNGTYLNGNRLGSDPQWLSNGDQIELGKDQVLLRFQAWTSTLSLPGLGAGGQDSGITMDLRSRQVWAQGVQVEPPLSRREFDVLELLSRHRGKESKKSDIAAHAWPERPAGSVSDQEIDECVRRLRLRVEPDPTQPRYVLTAKGNSYKLAKE